MRLNYLIFLVFLVLKCFGEEKTYKGIKTTILLYCPDKTDWKWSIDMGAFRTAKRLGNPPIYDQFAFHDGTATKNQHYIQMNSKDLQWSDDKILVRYEVGHGCTPDGEQTPILFITKMPLSTNKPPRIFLAANLKSNTQDADAYKKLFVEYFEYECRTGDCSSARERVDCSYHTDAKTVEQCKEGLEEAYKIHTGSENQSSTNKSSESKDSNTKLFIIIGVSVGVLLLIVGISVTVFCYRRKKKRSQNGSGMTGTQTGSGTTQQPTTTGTFQKTTTGGTGTTATGRY